jgi:hypothetical protein
MIEYKVYECEVDAEDTEKKLNEYAKKGWKVVCSYAYHNNWIILERDKINFRMCKK